jgi:hypothetical protein
MANHGDLGQQLAQELQPLRGEKAVVIRHAGEVAAGSAETGNQAEFDRVATHGEDDRNGGGRGLGGERGDYAASREDHRHFAPNQVSGKRRKPIILFVGVSVFDRQIATFDEASVLQSNLDLIHLLPRADEKSYDGH